MLLDSLGASLLGNLLKVGFLLQPHPLTNFEMQKYYQNAQLSSKNKRKFNGDYSRNNLPKK